MPRNGSGGYTPPLNSWNPPINSAQALPADWQAILADLASAIQASIAADGQTPISGILDFNNNRISGVGAPIAQGDALRFEQLTKGSNIASATTITIPKEGSLFEITGTTDIASITDTYPGRVVLLKFQDVLTLKNSAGFLLPGAVDVRTRNGDIAIFCNSETGAWECVYFNGAKDVEASSLNGGQLAGFRNLVINGRFKVNQREAASRTATPNAYNYDRWYYDGTYLYQGIEALDLFDGTFTLSWSGNSTAAYSLNTASSANQGAQSYTAVAKGGQITVSGHTNQTLWLRFSGDLSNLNSVQLEPGQFATPYEHRPYGIELSLCQRFYETGSIASSGLRAGISVDQLYNGCDREFAVTKREAPTVVLSNVSLTQAYDINVSLITKECFSVYVRLLLQDSNYQISSGSFAASAEL